MNAYILPADLSPETAAWMRMQMTIAAARAVEPLREELDALSDFVDGMYVVFVQVMPQLLIDSPALRERIAPNWRKVARRHDDLLRGAQASPDEDTLGMLEARALIFDACARAGVFGPADGKRAAPDRRRA